MTSWFPSSYSQHVCGVFETISAQERTRCAYDAKKYTELSVCHCCFCFKCYVTGLLLVSANHIEVRRALRGEASK